MKDDIEKKVQAISLDVRAKDCSVNNIYNVAKDYQHASHSLDHWQEHSDFIINKSKGNECNVFKSNFIKFIFKKSG